jgi:hypothetical protein
LNGLDFKEWLMPTPRVIDGILQFASASRSRAAVSLAAISFALCHLLVIATAPTMASVSGDAAPDVPRLLLHFAAVLCRFALPLSVLIIGMTFGGRKRSVIRIKIRA